MEIRMGKIDPSLHSVPSALPNAVQEIQNNLDDYRKMRDLVATEAQKGSSLTELMLFFSMQEDADFAVRKSEPGGVALAFQKDWHALSQEWSATIQTTPLNLRRPIFLQPILMELRCIQGD